MIMYCGSCSSVLRGNRLYQFMQDWRCYYEDKDNYDDYFIDNRNFTSNYNKLDDINCNNNNNNTNDDEEMKGGEHPMHDYNLGLFDRIRCCFDGEMKRLLDEKGLEVMGNGRYDYKFDMWGWEYGFLRTTIDELGVKIGYA